MTTPVRVCAPAAAPAGRAAEIVARLGMHPHPERGFFVETYRSPSVVTAPAPAVVTAPANGAQRAASTAIYFLVTREQPTTYLHRLLSDELFHLYEGGPMDVLLLRDGTDGASSSQVARLGLELGAGERPQLVIPARTWFAVELAPSATHCLFGCTVAPGFDFADFELALGPELASRFPEHAERISRMTRPTHPRPTADPA